MQDSKDDKPNGKPDAAKPDDTDSDYRDDRADFGAASDYAQTGTTGTYAGEGPGDADHLAGRHGSGNNAGSQEDWRGKKDEDAPQASAQPTGEFGVDPQKSVDQKGEPVVSRSDDPGQGSYGGFKDEGPADSEPDSPPDHPSK